MVTIQTADAGLAGQQIATDAGVFTLDADGKAQITLEVAASLLEHPAFTFPIEGEREQVQEFLGLSVPTAQGAYNPGRKVRLYCPEVAGTTVLAGDNQTVTFSPEGYAEAGENTVLELEKAMPGLQRLETGEAVNTNAIPDTAADAPPPPLPPPPSTLSDTDSGDDDDTPPPPPTKKGRTTKAKAR